MVTRELSNEKLRYNSTYCSVDAIEMRHCTGVLDRAGFNCHRDTLFYHLNAFGIEIVPLLGQYLGRMVDMSLVNGMQKEAHIIVFRYFTSGSQAPRIDVV